MKEILPVLVMIGTYLLCLGTFFYLRDCFKSRNEFSPVTWLAWTAAFFFQSMWAFGEQGNYKQRLIIIPILLFLFIMFLFSGCVCLFGSAFSNKKFGRLEIPFMISIVVLVAVFLATKSFHLPGFVDLFSLVALILGVIPLCQEIKTMEEPFSPAPWFLWVTGLTLLAVFMSFHGESSWLEVVCAWGYVATFLSPILLVLWIAVDSQGESPREPGSGLTGK